MFNINALIITYSVHEAKILHVRHIIHHHPNKEHMPKYVIVCIHNKEPAWDVFDFVIIYWKYIVNAKYEGMNEYYYRNP